FTAQVGNPGVDLVLLKGIIDLGTALGLKLIAEGIQTVEQQRIVEGLGCHNAQGFYFGYPQRTPSATVLPH
ncbi:MAG: hypothetical protein QOD85_1970, partial [Gaiellaceae bacterium]|nr:hypothetical protein [Gaiellaceae bacterium]